jgi:hypothetical protein
MKEKMLRVRIEKNLIIEFKDWCIRNNTSMSKVIYNYIIELLKGGK